MDQHRADFLREQYLLEASRWTFPVTDWEIATVAAIMTLATVSVVRLAPAFLSGLGMVPKQCHHNARNFAARMKQQGGRMVTGWIKQPRLLILHSVVEVDGRHFCVTPTPAVPGLEFEFIPDPAIELTEVPEGFFIRRGDTPLGIGLRRFARADQPWFVEAVARLRSGLAPDEALNFQNVSSSRAA